MLPRKLDVLGSTYEVVISKTAVPGKITVKPGDEDSQTRELMAAIIDLLVVDQEIELPEKALRLLKKNLGSVIVKNAHNIDWVMSSRLERHREYDSIPTSTVFEDIGDGIRIIKRTGI